MEHSFSMALGMACGMAFGVGFILIAARKMKRRGVRCGAYDERQKAAQGSAYKAAFWTLLIYLFAIALFDLATGVRWCSLFVAGLIGLCLAMGVFSVMCVWSDAYLSIKESPRYMTCLLTALGGINLFIGLWNAFGGEGVVTDGALNHHISSFLVGLLLLSVALALALRGAKLRREEED